MTGQPPGVIGIGQTKYSKARTDVSIPGLVREAASRALDDAGLDWGDIDALVMGKAPDIFEGVMQPELFEGARVFVLPNPSGRNANYSYLQMLEAFKRLRTTLGEAARKAPEPPG